MVSHKIEEYEVVMNNQEPVQQPDPNSETVDMSRKKSRYFHSDAVIPSGERFASCRIKRLISRGSMGMVYLARQPKLNRDVALKILLGSEYASEEQIRRFEREAQTVARLKHPNIVPIYDIGVYKDKNFFSMEYVEGEPLSDRIRSGRLTVRESLEIAKQVGRGLQAAHEAGVIHRDIKPANILLDKKGKAMITDFGLAKWIDSNTRFTRTGVAIGTPSYMSPEQAYGAADINPLTDVYSLGAVLYEMVTFSPPFTGSTHMEIIISVLNKYPPSPRKLNPRINRDIEIIIEKSMEKEPSLRYKNAKDMTDDIQRFIDGEAITARPTSMFIKGVKKIKKHKGVTAVTLFLTVFFMVILFWSFALWKEKRQLEYDQKKTTRELAIAKEQFKDLEEEKVVSTFQDSFRDDDLRKRGWVQPDGQKRWSVKDGYLVGKPAKEKASIIWCRTQLQNNMSLTADVILDDLKTEIGFFIGTETKKRGYGYYIRLNTKETNLLKEDRGRWRRPFLA